MSTLRLVIPLESGATFARGVRTPWLDVDTDWDPETGLPYVRRTVLRQVLVEGCADVLFALGDRESPPQLLSALEDAARALFGSPGSLAENAGAARVGRGLLPAPYREAVAHAVASGTLASREVLEAHTSVRAQTAVDPKTGAGKKGTLRTSRLVLRGAMIDGAVWPSTFEATLRPGPGGETVVGQALLAASAAGIRRLGLRRHRGRGRIGVTRLSDESGKDRMGDWLNVFEAMVST